MRTILTVCILFLLSFTVSGQSERWKQKNARINFALTPQVEFVKIAGGFSLAASSSASISFNNTHFIGGYLTKKVMPNYINYDYAPGVDLDANFQHGGIEYLYAKKLGVYRTKGGHYVHPKLRILMGSRIGVGLVWLDDSNKDRYTESDYFGYVQPLVGITYPLNDYMTLQTGITGTFIIKINKLDQYLAGKDFMFPGAFLGLRFTLFR